MKKIIVPMILSGIALGVGLIACGPAKKEKEAAHALSREEKQKRGEYLVNAIGCDDCHSPKTFGPNGPQIIIEKRFSGYPSDRPLPPIDSISAKGGWVSLAGDLTAAAGPWGVSFAANISSDSTGIGAWKEEQFIKAIREGKTKGIDNSRPMLPPMPWFNFAKLSDEDLKSIFVYLQSSKPVKNVVPQPIAPSAGGHQ